MRLRKHAWGVVKPARAAEECAARLTSAWSWRGDESRNNCFFLSAAQLRRDSLGGPDDLAWS